MIRFPTSIVIAWFLVWSRLSAGELVLLAPVTFPYAASHGGDFLLQGGADGVASGTVTSGTFSILGGSFAASAFDPIVDLRVDDWVVAGGGATLQSGLLLVDGTLGQGFNDVSGEVRLSGGIGGWKSAAGFWPAMETVAVVPPPLAGPADLVVTGVAVPTVVAPQELVTYTFTVTNRGRESAPEVNVASLLPSNGLLVSAKVSQGIIRTVGIAYAAQLGEVVGGGSATVTLVLKSLTVGQLICSAAADLSGTEEPDPTPINNLVSVVVPVQTSGGLPVAIPVPRLLGAGAGSAPSSLGFAPPPAGFVLQTATDIGGIPAWTLLIPLEVRPDGTWVVPIDPKVVSQYFRYRRQ